MHCGKRRLLPGGHTRGDRTRPQADRDGPGGNLVWAFDLVTGEWRLCRVAETYVTDYIGEKIRIRVAGEWIESTRHHPVWVVEGKNLEERPRPEHVRQAETADATVPGRWVDAGDVQTGDVLLLKPDRRATVEAREVQLIAAKVYNFQVEELHNYAVGFGSVLVHNNAPCDPIGPTPRKSSATIRREWEAATGEAWPSDPATGYNQDVSHDVPLADGGTNDLSNISPLPHADHVQIHVTSGDFKRWGARAGRGG